MAGHMALPQQQRPDSVDSLWSRLNQVTRAHLDRRLDRDPGREHETGVQGLGSHAEVHATPGIAGPDVLVSTRQAGELHSSCGQIKETLTL